MKKKESKENTKEEKRNLLKFIIPVVAGIAILGGSLYISTSKGITTSTFTESTKKAGKDASDMDWTTYKTYDVDLSKGGVNITKGGVYYLSGTLKSGMIKVSTNDSLKLVLQDVKITSKNGPAIYIMKAKNTYIELEGESTIEAKTSSSLDGAIFSKDDLYFLGDGSLTITSNYDGIKGKDDLYFLSGTYNITSDTDGIKGKDIIEIKDGTYTITAKQDGIKTTNEEEKGDIVIENGTFKIIANQDGIQAQSTLTVKDGKYTIVSGNTTKSDESQKGLKAASDLVIEKGEFNISSVDDAIHSNTNVTIQNGTYNISTNDDAIHADSTVTIKDGEINISKSYEGIEGYNINLEGGKISVIASDDGINIGGGNDTSGTNNNGRRDAFDQDNGGLLTISGGEIYVNASGDGLDSNGSIRMTGGIVHVDGPTNSGNGALDYNGTFNITGGELIAVGSTGMAQSVSSGTTQNTIMINLSSSTSGDLSLGDITYSPTKTYQSIIISSPKLELNKEYTLKAGSTTQSVTLTSTVSQSGQGNMMGGGNMIGRGNMMDRGNMGGNRGGMRESR